MTDDVSDRKKQATTTNPDLSEDAVERAKSAILFGVGYRHPPQHTRFRKGQSGNPKGRPKSAVGLHSGRSANALALREGERLIPVREGNDVRQIPAIEAVFRAQLKAAIGGNAHAQKQFILRYGRGEWERRREIAEEIELYGSYVAMARQEIADAEAKGEAPPVRLPHPDDIVFDFEKGVRIVGPRNEDELARLNDCLKVRDVLIMQDALDWSMTVAGGADVLDRPGAALLFALVLNNCAPERFRLSDTEIQLRSIHYGGTPKRALLKELYRAWRTLGINVPRGKTFPSLRYAKNVMEAFAERLSPSTHVGLRVPGDSELQIKSY